MSFLATAESVESDSIEPKDLMDGDLLGIVEFGFWLSLWFRFRSRGVRRTFGVVFGVWNSS